MKIDGYQLFRRYYPGATTDRVEFNAWVRENGGKYIVNAPAATLIEFNEEDAIILKLRFGVRHVI